MKVFWGAVAAAVVGLSFGAAAWLWPLVHGSDPDWSGYQFTWHLGRVVLGVIPAFIAFIIVFGVMRNTRSLMWSAVLCSVALLGIAAYLSWFEYMRLGSAVAQGWSLPAYMRDQRIEWLGVAGACVPVVAIFVIMGLAPMVPTPPLPGDVQAPKRAKSGVHGSADFMAMAEVAKRFPDTVSAQGKGSIKNEDGVENRPVISSGSIIIGECYRVDRDIVRHLPFDPRDRETWGRGGKASLICYDPMRFSGPTHILVISGSGGFKTTSIMVTTCLTYGYSLVAIDPDQQAYSISKDARLRMGQTVRLVDPNAPGSGFNVLDWINPSDPRSPEHLSIVASWVCNTRRTGRETEGFFSSQGVQLVTGLLAYVLFEPDLKPSDRTLRHVRELISLEANDLGGLVKQMVRSPPHPFVKLALGPLVGMYYATFSGITSNASELTKWLTFAPLADLVSVGDFPTSKIADGETSVFLGIDVELLGEHPGLARTLIGALLNATKLAGENLFGRVLFLIDEAARLGHMKVLEEMRDTGRKYGVTLVMLYQSLGQIRDQWGGEAGLSNWMQGTGCQIFGAISDQDTADRISKMAGTYTAEVTSTSTSTVARGSTGGSGVNRSTTTSFVSVPVIRASDVTQKMRADEQIVFFGNMAPIRCGRAIYFRRPQMLWIAGEDRFAKIGRTTLPPAQAAE